MSTKLCAKLLLTAAVVLSLMSTAPSLVAAQETGTIGGRVVEATTQRPLAGAQIFVPGTQVGTLSGADGRYLLTGVPVGQAEVHASLIGYREASREVTVRAGELATVDIALDEAAVELDELIVTATGLQRAREIGNAIATVNAGEVTEKIAPVSVERLLQSQVAGVTLRQNTGTVGTASDFRIRGAASISLSNRPLVYIDGARIKNEAVDAGTLGQDYSRLNDLNPADIESVEIVKGPAAATLYGTEAAGGVIRITTKQGRAGETRYQLRADYGANWNIADFEPTVWNPRSFFPDAPDTLYTMRLLETDSPWRTGWEKTLGLNISGNLENVNYYIAGQWTDQNGPVVTNWFEKYNLRGNLTVKPTEKLDLAISTGYANTAVQLPQADNSGSGLIAQAYLGFPWVMPITRTDPNDPSSGPIRTCPTNFEEARVTGTPLAELGFTGCNEKPGFGGRDQADLATLTNSQQTGRFTGSADLTFRPVSGWTNRFTAGIDQVSDKWLEIVPVDPDLPFGNDSQGAIQNREVRGYNLTLEASSSYALPLTDDLATTTTVGAQYFNDVLEYAEAQGSIFPAGSPSVATSVIKQGTDSYFESKTLGLFVQEQIGWKDRIFLTPAVRFDDNSAFGRELGLKVYPRVSASWVVSDEGWSPEFLQVLKLRAAWGQSGKQPGPNDALGLLDPTPVIFQGENVLGVAPNRPGNAELKPETGTELEVGFDTRVLNSRVGLELTYYWQRTEDALVARPLALSTGFPEERWENVGEIRNRGLEISLDAAAIDRPDLFWEWRLLLSTNDNEVTELPDPIIFGTQRHVQGYPFAGYWDRPVFIGPDGAVQTSDEFVFLGQPTPEWEGGLSTTLAFFDRRVQLYANLGFAGGHQLLDFSEVFRCRWVGGGTYGGVCTDLFEKNADGTDTDEARIKQRASQNNFSNAPWVEDADFAKLRTVSVQFELPRPFISALGVRNANLRVVGENLGLWTGYGGLDPELSQSGVVSAAGTENAGRSEFYTVPPPRRLITSITLTF